MRKLASTLWLFRAGVVAALLQCVMVILAVSGLASLSHYGLMGPVIIERAGRADVSQILPWTFLLLALNSALTNRRVRARTAPRIRQISHRMNPAAPKEGMRELTGRLWLAMIWMAVLTIAEPPHIAIAAASHLGCPAIVLVGWPGVMSIATAWCGGIAFAVHDMR